MNNIELLKEHLNGTAYHAAYGHDIWFGIYWYVSCKRLYVRIVYIWVVHNACKEYDTLYVCPAYKQCDFIHLMHVWNNLSCQLPPSPTSVFHDLGYFAMFFTCPVHTLYAKGTQAVVREYLRRLERSKADLRLVIIYFYNHLFSNLRDRFLVVIRLSRFSWWLCVFDICLAYPFANDPLNSKLSIPFHNIIVSYGVY